MTEHTSPARSYRLWIGMILSAVCLVSIFFFIDPARIWAALKTARYGFLLLSALSFIAFMLLRAVRWRFMLTGAVTFGTVFHVQNIGYMLTMILPLRLGDVARALLIGSVPPITIPQGISTMVVERLLDLLFMVALLPLSLASVPTLPPGVRAVAVTAGILALAGTAFLIVAANQRQLAERLFAAAIRPIRFLDPAPWRRRFSDLLDGLYALTSWRGAIILLALSVLVWLPVISAYYWGLEAVHLAPTPAMAGFVVVAAALSIAAPSSPGQVGVYHAGVIAALTQVLGQPEAAAASFAFLYHGMSFFLNVILGLIGLRFIDTTLENVVKLARRSGRERV